MGLVDFKEMVDNSENEFYISYAKKREQPSSEVAIKWWRRNSYISSIEELLIGANLNA